MSNGIKNNNKVDQLLKDIRSGKAGRDKVLIKLYQDEKLRFGILSVIKRMGATQESIEAIFSTTLMQFVKTVINKKDLVIRNEYRTSYNMLY